MDVSFSFLTTINIYMFHQPNNKPCFLLTGIARESPRKPSKPRSVARLLSYWPMPDRCSEALPEPSALRNRGEDH